MLEKGVVKKVVVKKDMDFTQRADECALHAATAHNERAREVWAKMEQYWRKRAASTDAPLVPNHPPVRTPAHSLTRPFRN
jgi:hypothetical protein